MNRITTNVFWRLAERILAQIVSLLVTIVLSRILMPDDYGSVAIVTIFITFANTLVSSGIPSSLIQKNDADKYDFSSMFFFNIGFSIIIYVILFLSADFIADFYSLPILTPVIRVMGIRVIVAAINSIQQAYIAKRMEFKKFFFATLFGTILSGVVGIFMAYKGFGVWALVCQYMTNTCVDTIVLWFTIKWRPIPFFSWKRVKGLLRFGWKILFEGLSNNLANELKSLIIGRVYTTSDLAFYKKGDTFPALIVNNVSTSISSVLFPAMSNLQESKEKVLQLLRKSTRFSFYVIMPLLAGLALTSESLIALVFTEKWLPCVPYLRIFCFTRAASVAMIPRHQALNAMGRSDVYMVEHIIYRVITLLILVLVYKKSVLYIAYTGVAGSIIMLFTVAFTSKKYNDYKYFDQIKDVLPVLIGCLIMGTFVSCVNFLSIPVVWKLILQVLVGIVSYLLFSIICKMDEFYICKNYFFSFLKRLKSTGGKRA